MECPTGKLAISLVCFLRCHARLLIKSSLQRKVKAACYAMVDRYRDGHPDRELPTWTEFPNQLLQAAREQVLAEDARDGAILSRPNGQAALDWLFGTAYNNMKREMARGRPRDRPGTPDAAGQGSPLVGHTQNGNLSGVPDIVRIRLIRISAITLTSL